MSFENKKQNTSSSKLLIVFVLLALFICFIAILVWINAIDLKKTHSIEVMKTTTINASVTEPLVSMSDEDLSVESIVVPAIETTMISKEVEDVDSSSTYIGTPSVAYSITTSTTPAVNKVVFEKYTVKDGDTLASIANDRNLRTQTLVSVNSLKTVYPTVGSVLLIPNQDGQFYTVQEGDTFFSIAQRFSLSISWKTLKAVNRLDDENISAGMLLFIPYNLPEKEITNMSSFVDETSFVSPVLDAYTYGKYDQKINNPLSNDTEYLDGILLQTLSAAVVMVAEDGFVVDKGVNEVNRTWFIKVSHANGYTTYYDYLNSTNVEIGQKLSKGDVVGQIKEGNTKLDIPTLFFRIEQDGISLDPSLFF